MFKSFFKRRLSASALQAVLTISIIIILVITFLLGLSLSLKSLFLKDQRFQQLNFNSLSGLNLLLSSETINFSEELRVDLYGMGTDSVLLKKIEWGLYEVHIASAFKDDDIIRKMGITGKRLSSKERFALYLSDQHLPLSFSGRSYVKGDVYISAAGVRKSNIEGQEFEGTRVIFGKTKISNAELPKIDSALLLRLSEMFNQPYDGIQFHTSYADSLNCSFNEPTFYILKEDSLELNHVFLKGNIILISNNPVVIDSSSNIEDVLLFAPSIIIKNGFRGSIQAFAQDSIRLKNDVYLEYPSVLGLLPKSIKNADYINHPSIIIDSASRVTGIVFTTVAFHNQPIPLIQLDNHSTVNGQVYSSGLLQLQGIIEGSAITKGFILKTSSTVYDNFILNGSINLNNLSEYYIGSKIFNKDEASSIIKWVE
ncbi:hypothetical protein [Albibacterium sp.]|uniref:hypothetical protein n=1 Tax=Albibacterium sp. TaxID=2952885 RepID=UPI002BDADBA9|nr:hypothetical protein [Albibacterium sp.]HUH17849.1 hypothetical protein [Albibacterium sp.]